MFCVFGAGSVVYSIDVVYCVGLGQILFLYIRDVVCCVCLEQVVLLYSRDVFCVVCVWSR